MRYVESSWAFARAAMERAARGEPVVYRALDITRQPAVDALEFAMACPGIDFAFTEGDDLRVPAFQSELLFVDTCVRAWVVLLTWRNAHAPPLSSRRLWYRSWHTYGHLARELMKWAPLVSDVMLIHDTK